MSFVYVKELVRRILSLSIATGCLLMARPQALGFSMVGPFPAWQVQTIGYSVPNSIEIGGPMNLGEEYRWNRPVITYGFTSAFYNYFGNQGAAEIDAAFQILQDLPETTKMSDDLSEFPLDTRRVNFRAAALDVISLRAVALNEVIAYMGLSEPERYTWTLRGRRIQDELITYTVLKRNFDPITWEPSSFVNGSLYTYIIEQTWANVWEAVPYLVDPLRPGVTSVAGLGTPGQIGDLTPNVFNSGLFVNGLTRDDAGGLRYIYRPNNYNIENLPPDAELNFEAFLSGGLGSPWAFPGETLFPPPLNPFLPPLFGTNTIPIINITNIFSVPTNFPITDTALRRGVDKLNYQRMNQDSFLDNIFTPVTNSYVDSYVSNRTLVTQPLQLVSTAPDFVFDAEDLGLAANVAVPVRLTHTLSPFQNNAALNGPSVVSGPGTIDAPITITFSSIGPFFVNAIPTDSPNNPSEETAFLGVVWGSFDASTNAPIIFPSGESIRELEKRVLGF